MAKVGRPSIYSVELGQRICDRLASGENILDICESERISWPSVHLWKRKHQEFSIAYAQARENSADLFEARLLQLANTADAANYNAVRLKVDTLKWAAAKRLPHVYSDRQQLDVTAKLTLETLITATLPAPKLEPPTIEGEKDDE